MASLRDRGNANALSGSALTCAASSRPCSPALCVGSHVELSAAVFMCNILLDHSDFKKCVGWGRSCFDGQALPRLWRHSLYQSCARRAGFEWICEVLRFPRDLVALKLHDAYRIRRLVVIRQDEFGNP